jgi:hypothetical protein
MPFIVPRIQSYLAPLAATLLLVGSGMLGWLAAHIVTFNALGHAAAHMNHGYMAPIERVGITTMLVGIVMLCGLLLGARNAFTDGSCPCPWLCSSGPIPWLAAACVPAVVFVVLDLVQGVFGMHGAALYVVGLPLQALVGAFLLWVVRELLQAIVRIAELLDAPTRFRAPARALRLPGMVSTDAVCPSRPMACNAARRAPPELRAVSFS